MKKVSIKILILFIILYAFFASCKVTVNPKPDKEKELYEAAKKMPLTLLAEEDGTIKLRHTDCVNNFKYTINGGEPVSVCSGITVDVDVLKGYEVCFYGEGTNNDNTNFFNIICNSDCSVYGNVMSLLTNDYQTATEITTAYAFRQLFCDSFHLKNHQTKKLVLPATTLASGCYFAMFLDCPSLKEAPTLPATTLADSCYIQMFADCTSLIKAPELPATTLAGFCYRNMFQGCTSLTTAPELPATNLASSCYDCMFKNCTSLEEAPKLPATTLAQNCYGSMFRGCTSITKAPELPATTLAQSCYEAMFCGCSSLEVAPDLPAETLVFNCYGGMFSGCINLNSIKCLAADISASGCTNNWLRSVASEGSFITPKETQWNTGNSGIPNGWTRVNAQ